MSDPVPRGANRSPFVRDCDMMTQSSLCIRAWLLGVRAAEGWPRSHICTEGDRGSNLAYWTSSVRV